MLICSEDGASSERLKILGTCCGTGRNKRGSKIHLKMGENQIRRREEECNGKKE